MAKRKKTIKQNLTGANPFLVGDESFGVDNEEEPLVDEQPVVPVKIQPNVTIVSRSAEDSGSDNDDETMSYAKVKLQRDLVAQAFAGDDVVAEFEAEKDKVVQEDAPQDIDTTLPGWGSWVGKGVKQRDKRMNRFMEHVPGIEDSRRKDNRLQGVIINEKRNKKVEKYLATSVPFPYHTKEQYSRTLRMPLGKEWLTRTSMQKITKPRVITKSGALIHPPKVPKS